ncbi:MAG: VCBS repeat-containing protein [Pirellulaceae bacterium]|nr:VCBS repeat-containing protein [Pirellulaceae bacterium]MDG2104152.1 VCBS repeat-containing protein [Pirellulaceae bacterium]
MMKRKRNLAPAILLSVLITCAACGPLTLQGQVTFQAKMLQLDANEGIAAGDIDGDGDMDLVAGRNWFSNPDWVPRPLRTIEDWNGYVQSNGDFLFDVNQDGRLDVIAGSFLPTTVHWFENPGPSGLEKGHLWKKHLLVDTGVSSNEGQLLEDLDGDGRPEWIVNSWQKNVPTTVWRWPDDSGDAAADENLSWTLQPHQLGATGNGHGLGVGDVNGDGKKDVLTGQGWYEQPSSDPWKNPWEFHAEWDFEASLPVIVTDLNGDQRNDLIIGKGHEYGLFWMRNEGPDATGSIRWKEIAIDREYSQPHTLAWVDIDADGREELITGKRVRAHNGGDPGGKEPACLFYYKWDPKTNAFQRYTIEQGHVGCGLQIVTADLSGDHRVDIAVAGKSGTFLLIQNPQ